MEAPLIDLNEEQTIQKINGLNLGENRGGNIATRNLNPEGENSKDSRTALATRCITPNLVSEKNKLFPYRAVINIGPVLNKKQNLKIFS